MDIELVRAEWIRQLERLRFDIVRREPLQGHKESGSQSVQIFVTDDGQVRLVLTRLLDGTKSEKRKSRAGREYHIFREQSNVTIVNYTLRLGEDLGTVVNEMEKEIAG